MRIPHARILGWVAIPFSRGSPDSGVEVMSLFPALAGGSLPLSHLESPEINRHSLSVQFSHSVLSDPLQPHRLLHARLPCPSPTPKAHSNSWPSSWWCHPTISSFVVPFSSHLQSFPASGSSPMSQFFPSGGQRIGISASPLVLLIFRTDFL